MRPDLRFVLVTAALYAGGIAWSVYERFWTCAPGDGWPCYAAGAGGWSALVLAGSAAWLARRRFRRSNAWLAAHAATAVVLGIVAGWLLLELRMRGSSHGWDPENAAYGCLVCPSRGEGLRLAALALVTGAAAAAPATVVGAAVCRRSGSRADAASVVSGRGST